MFKDINGIVLKEGDLIMLDYRRLTEASPAYAIFKQVVTELQRVDNTKVEKGTLIYYPLTEQGLTLIKYENGEYDNGEKGIFKTDPFLVLDVQSRFLTKVTTSSLDNNALRIYNEINSRLIS